MIGHAKRRLLATDRQQEIRLSSVFLPSHRKRPPPSSTAQIRPLLEFFASREVPQSISSRVRKFHLATPQPPRMCSPVFLRSALLKYRAALSLGFRPSLHPRPIALASNGYVWDLRSFAALPMMQARCEMEGQVKAAS